MVMCSTCTRHCTARLCTHIYIYNIYIVTAICFAFQVLGGCPIDTSSNPKLQDRGIHNQLAFFVLQTYTVNQEIFIQDFFTVFNFSFLYRKLIFKFLILVFLDSNENYMTMKIFLLLLLFCSMQWWCCSLLYWR